MTSALLKRLGCLEKRVALMEDEMLNGVVYISTNYTVTSADSTIVAITSGGAFNIRLPDATANEGRRLTFKRIPNGGQPATILPLGTDTIDGGSSMVLVNDYSSVSFRASRGQWLVTASYNN